MATPDPDDLEENDLNNLTDEQIAELFDREHTPVELMLLAGYARPATAAPRQIDLHRRIDDLPALDDYHLTGSEARR
ncbi:hypothetical protein EES45_23075 [Streptomyces sp. ADI97-07]|uniref:hypothetical protein n=1 Tax=Streptomyces sp. ADI97-07 TaxID=1522762 RepID=UPI000F54D471|nr:hypothetical protein [Streptomyces sp. ADI97-07]RPK76377.1 hypothetical protein EES45_23075 [Streptomyces sp. ADI97-07]